VAVSYSCDGCGCAIKEAKVVGMVIKRDYCEACEKVANAFQEAEEAERLSVATVFKGKREKLIEQYGQSGFKLPDVPDA